MKTNMELLKRHLNNLPPDYIEQVARAELLDAIDELIATYFPNGEQLTSVTAWDMTKRHIVHDGFRWLYTHAGGWFDNAKFVPAKEWEATHGTLPNMKRWTRLWTVDAEWVYTGDEVEPIEWQEEFVTYLVQENVHGGYCLIDKANNVISIDDMTKYQKVGE